MQEPFTSQLQQAFANTQDVQKLFWHSIPAQRPKTRTNAAGHDNAIVILVHEEKVVSSDEEMEDVEAKLSDKKLVKW